MEKVEAAKKKKKRKKKGTSSRIKDDAKDMAPSDDDYESEMRKAKAASLFTGKAEKDEDADDRGRDRGPFGEGFSVVLWRRRFSQFFGKAPRPPRSQDSSS